MPTYRKIVMALILLVFMFILIGVLEAQTPIDNDLMITDYDNSDNSQEYNTEPLQPKRKILYFDAGLSFNSTRLNFASKVSSDGFDGKEVRYINNYSIPNLNARLGFRVSEKFILVSDFQTIGIKDDFYLNIGIIMPGLIHVMDRKVNVNPIHYYGGGLIFYPHPRFQAGTTIGEAILPFVTHNTKNGESVNNPDLLGMGYSLSLAYDVPFLKIGFLVGCSFFYAPVKDELKVLIPTTDLYSIGLFTKIRY